ncbi:MAG: transglutaminase domain-containing protein, partial [Dehalococcoidia bacterium]
MNILARRRAWSQRSIRHSPVLRLFGMYDAMLLTVAVVTVAVILPTNIPKFSLLERGYDYMRWPIEELRGDFNRLFAGIPARKPHRFRTFDTTLPFQGTINLGDEVVFTLISSQPGYWRVRSYPTYTSQGWISDETQIVPTEWQPGVTAPFEYKKREVTIQQVELNFSPRLLMATGIARGADVDLEAEIPLPPAHTIHLDTPAFDTLLPTDIQELAGNLRRMAQGEGNVRIDFNNDGPAASVVLTSTLSEEDIRTLLPDDLELVGVEADETGALVRITVRRPIPIPLDVLSIRSESRLFSSNQYTVASSVSVATPQDLKGAGETYPGWVTDIYLQLPDTLPQRVKDLARSLTVEAKTPYDKALAIRDYLHTLPYNLSIPAPAFDADGVDHFLFVVHTGYSDYFASAMTVMMRAVEVPARMAVGYGFGEGDERGNVIVRDRNSHGWVEVFFPDYGWVEFEPTPGREGPYVSVIVQEPSPRGMGAEDVSEEDDDDLTELGFTGPSRTVSGGGSFPLLELMVLGTGVLGLAFLATLGFRWLMGSPSTVAGVYGKMARLSTAGGFGPYDGQTPWEYGTNLAQHLPGVAPEVTSVVGTYTKDLYGTQAVSESEQTRIVEDWRAIRWALFGRALRLRRRHKEVVPLHNRGGL